MSKTYSEILEWLYARHRFGMTRTLETTKKLVEYFGHPEKSAMYIHVTGTNGKGTSCALVANVLTSAGYKVGLYTSPHLVDWRERIRINHELVSIDLVTELLNSIRPLAEQCNATFFEITTAVAFKVFQEMSTDLNVIEVGIGGTWDSTNIIHPIVAHITKIDLDHTEILGKNRIEIARDKTGIWKPNSIATSSKQTEGVYKFLSERWKIRKSDDFFYAPLFFKSENFRKTRMLNHSNSVRISSIHPLSQTFLGNEIIVDFPFLGKHQLDNLNGILTVLLALHQKGITISLEKLKVGIETTRWKGRFEKVMEDPLVFADVAHNPSGIEALLKTLKLNYLQEGGTIHLIFGLLLEKDLLGIANQLSKYHLIGYSVPLKNAKSRDPKEIAFELQRRKIECNPYSNASEAFHFAKKRYQNGDVILITGSHYLVGEFFSFFSSFH